MNIQDLQTIIDSTLWDSLGGGTYNRVSVSRTSITIEGYTGKWVLKKATNPNNYCSTSSRSVRKWNSHNPKYPAFETQDGWIAPYLGDTPASDEQISKKLIEIYQKTKNIIADACIKKRGNYNFLDYQGDIICVDVDLSLRRGSFASDNFLDSAIDKQMKFLHAHSAIMPKTVSVIKTLLYLDPFFSNDDTKHQYITANLMAKFHFFIKKQEPITTEIIDTLLEIESLNLLHEIDNKLITTAFVKKLIALRKDSVITKKSIANLIHESLWDYNHMSGMSNEAFLNKVQMLIQHDPSLINIIGQDGYTLLHIAVMCKNINLVRYLIQEGAELNMLTPSILDEHPNLRYPSMTAIDIALSSSSRETTAIVVLLAQSSATIPHTLSALLSEDEIRTGYWAISPANPVAQFREELYCLAANKSGLSESRKTEILQLMKQHTHFLTWGLDHHESTFLHLAFYANHARIIQEWLALPQWNDLSKIVNKNNLSLFDIIASNGFVEHYERLKHLPTSQSDWARALRLSIANGHEGFVRRLLAEGVSPDAVYNGDSALMTAASKGHAPLLTLLLTFGANPAFKTEESEPAESLWSKSFDTNPVAQFRRELRSLAANKSDLSESRKTELLQLIKQHTHFLTWGLNHNESTFLHLAFNANHARLIQELVDLPQWNDLSKTVNKGNCSLFDVIASNGFEEHYERLKHLLTSQSDWTYALCLSVENGHEGFVRRLLADGDSDYSIDDSATAEEAWLKLYPLKKNPFNLYSRTKHLEQKQAQLIEIIQAQLPNQHFIWTNNFKKANELLFDLQQKIHLATFISTDNPDKTADDALSEIITNWEFDHFKSDLFDQHSPIGRTVKTITRLLHSKLTPSQPMPLNMPESETGYTL